MTKTAFNNITGCESTSFVDEGDNTIIDTPTIGYWSITTNYTEFASYVGEGVTVGLKQTAGALTIDHPNDFHGMISLLPLTEALPPGTLIDLVGLGSADGASLTGNMLNITEHGQIIDQLRLDTASWGPGGMTVGRVANDLVILSGHYTGVVDDPSQVLLRA